MRNARLPSTLYAAGAVALMLLSSTAKAQKKGQTGSPLSGEQSALVDRAIQRERKVIADVRLRTPVVETYMQKMRPDATLGQVPVSDEHIIGRVDFGKIIGQKDYEPQTKASRFAMLRGLTPKVSEVASFQTSFTGTAFVQMLLMDSKDFDRQHYSFFFVRNDFLGATPTTVFDVTPTHGDHDFGRFFGRIWVEKTGGNVVRMNGEFAGSTKGVDEFYHFDSWRTNVQPDVWLPTTVYVDQRDAKSATSTLRFKATMNIWGYNLKTPQQIAESTSIEVLGLDANGTQTAAVNPTDTSPRDAQAALEHQAEDNVVDRLFKAGLVDAPSDFDRTLEDLANNILAYNHVPIGRPVRVRTLLTEPLESTSIGHTILISKSLLDTTAIKTKSGQEQLADLNALLAFQLAHILNGDRVDTQFAFEDKLMFPDNATFKRLPLHHDATANEQAAKRAIEMLSAPELADGQRAFGLYLEQLVARAPALKALNDPLLGDSLLNGTTPWMAAMMGHGEKLDPASLNQQAAEPLSKFLHCDPWTDQLKASERATEPVLSASDKMPFEVTPVYLKLAYWTPAAEDAAAPFSGLVQPAAAPVDAPGQVVSPGGLAVPVVAAPVTEKMEQNGLARPATVTPAPRP